MATNDLVQADGSYNPDKIDWYFSNMANCCLALADILKSESLNDPDKLTINFTEAAKIITDVQYFAYLLQSEQYAIECGLEYYNYYYSFVEEKGLRSEFNQFLSKAMSKGRKEASHG